MKDLDTKQYYYNKENIGFLVESKQYGIPSHEVTLSPS